MRKYTIKNNILKNYRHDFANPRAGERLFGRRDELLPNEPSVVA